VEVVLIEASEEENLIFLNGTTDGGSALLLAAMGLKSIMGSVAPNPLSRM